MSFNRRSLKLEINYLLDNYYFYLGSMCFLQLIGIPLGSVPAPVLLNYYYIRKWLFPTKRWVIQMTRMVLHISGFYRRTMYFYNNQIENSRRKIKSIVKLRFWTCQQKSMIGILPLSCFIKGTLFPFVSIACPIWIAIYHLKYFMLQLVLKFYALQRQQQT